MSSSERAIGRAAARIWRSTGNTLSIHQRATSGNDSSRSVSPVGAQSTTITSHSPEWWCCLEHQQREQLVHSRRDRELLGRDAVDAALEQQLAEPLLHARPVALHLLLGLDLLAPQMLGRRQRLANPTRRRATPTGCARGRWRSPACAARRRRSARAVHAATEVLPTPALAGVEDRPRPHRPRESMASVASRVPGAVPMIRAEVAGQVGRGQPHRGTASLRERRDRERVHAVGEARAGVEHGLASRARRRSRRCEIFDSRKRIVDALARLRRAA